jgi:hypothetical protein
MLVRGVIFRHGFAHRMSNNGMFDSICVYCLDTVASLSREIDLEAKEDDHVCWQRRARLNKFQSSRTDRVIQFPGGF